MVYGSVVGFDARACALRPALVTAVLLGISAAARAVSGRAEEAAGARGKVAIVVHGVASVERALVDSVSVPLAACSDANLLGSTTAVASRGLLGGEPAGAVSVLGDSPAVVASLVPAGNVCEVRSTGASAERA